MQGVELYEENTDQVQAEQFVYEYRSLVKKIALHLKRRLPAHVELEDLLQSGFVGLLEARQHFKRNMGASFETYASIRIKGSIIDALRRNSWGTRESIRNMREIGEAIAKIEQRTQQAATAEEIAAELGISVEEHDKICQQISVCHVLSLDVVDTDNELLGDDDAANPQRINQEEEIKLRIKELITTLPQREQMVLSLYYIEEFTYKQIGEILDLTEARICQLHSQAISRIQTRLKKENIS